MWNFRLSWVILIPLLFFATNGNILPKPGGATSDSTSHQVGVGVVIALCSVLIFTRLAAVFAAVQRAKLLIGLPLLALLSSVWSQNPRQTIISGSILLVFTLFALYFATSFAPRQQFELLMLAGGVALSLSIALALLAPDLGAPGHAWRGIFAHKQNCAALGTLLLVTSLHWKASGIYQRIFRFSCGAMCLLLIVMSQSRTGWGLALFALCLSVCLLLLQSMPAREGLLASMLTAGVFAGVAYAVYAHAALILPAVGKDVTLDQRTIIWSAAWRTIAQNPILGYGYGAFWTGLQGASLNIVLISGWELQQSQNGFLDLWLQAGVGCVVLIALVTSQAAWNGIRCFRSSGEDRYVRWCIVMIVCTLAYNIGESSLGMIHLVWFLFLLACIGLQQTAQAMHAETVLDTDEHRLLVTERILLQEKNGPIGSLSA